MDLQKLEGRDPLYLSPINEDRGVLVAAQGLLVVHNQFFGFLGVEVKVVIGTPCYQMLSLFPVGCLIIIPDKANQHSVTC